MEFKADLHCHTTCSDGSLSPIEILRLAKEQGLQGLSITDHDTIEAYQEETFAEARALGIDLRPGVEFSCHLMNASVHLLGYGFDIKNPKLLAFCQRHQERRRHRNLAILRKLKLRGLAIAEEELYPPELPEKVIGRPHVAQLMVDKGFVKTIREAFERYIGDNKSCFDAGRPFSILETIEILHEAGGKAFIAHPQLIHRKKILKALYQMPFDGMECYYGTNHRHSRPYFLEKAKEKGWIPSGGSDFHGSMRPFTQLGASFVNQAEFETIFSPRIIPPITS